MGLFFRVYQHLLPDGAAWRLTVTRTLRRFFEGLSDWPADARSYIDGVWANAFPGSTTELAEYEAQFGLIAPATTEARRLQLAASWMAQGGQSPAYLQDTVQAAGFDLYLHEWWDPNATVVPQTQCGEPLAQCDEPAALCMFKSALPIRNPRDYTNDPLLGTVQCGEDLSQCGEPAALCDNFLVNEPGYIVNLNLTRRPPPNVPTDPARWPYFMYWGAETFPDRAEVPADRRAELERLVKKICPTQQWLVMLVDYV